MRLLLWAVLTLVAVVLGPTREPHGGCDYDFGAGNGTAYLVVNNPYNLTLFLDISYQSGERKYSEVRYIPNTRVIVFCGLGNGWLYIKQHISPLGSPLLRYPLAVPRYVVIRAGESTTITVTTLFAPATTIAVAVFLLLAIVLRPKLGRWTFYAITEPLRAIAIWGTIWSLRSSISLIISGEILLLLSLFLPVPPQLNFLELIRSVLLPLVGYISDISDDLFMELGALISVYVIWSLGGFFLTFHRRHWIYIYI